MKYFRLDEFNCKHTGKNKMNYEFLSLIDELRGKCGFPFVVTSGYRDASHPDEVKKDSPGFHNKGVAVDISINNSVERHKILKEAYSMGFHGIGIADGFIHIDARELLKEEEYEVTWTY